MGKSGKKPYDKGKNFFDISINTGKISMGYEADNLEKVRKLVIRVFPDACDLAHF